MSDIRNYDVIVSPVITEKATGVGTESGRLQHVARDASKPEIKRAVEGLFGVKVTAVNTVLRKGKVKRFRGHLGKQSDVKKAIVTLAEGQAIDVTTGL